MKFENERCHSEKEREDREKEILKWNDLDPSGGILIRASQIQKNNNWEMKWNESEKWFSVCCGRGLQVMKWNSYFKQIHRSY